MFHCGLIKPCLLKESLCLQSESILQFHRSVHIFFALSFKIYDSPPMGFQLHLSAIHQNRNDGELTGMKFQEFWLIYKVDDRIVFVRFGIKSKPQCVRTHLQNDSQYLHVSYIYIYIYNITHNSISHHIHHHYTSILAFYLIYYYNFKHNNKKHRKIVNYVYSFDKTPYATIFLVLKPKSISIESLKSLHSIIIPALDQSSSDSSYIYIYISKILLFLQ